MAKNLEKPRICCFTFEQSLGIVIVTEWIALAAKTVFFIWLTFCIPIIGLGTIIVALFGIPALVSLTKFRKDYNDFQLLNPYIVWKSLFLCLELAGLLIKTIVLNPTISPYDYSSHYVPAVEDKLKLPTVYLKDVIFLLGGSASVAIGISFILFLKNTQRYFKKMAKLYKNKELPLHPVSPSVCQSWTPQSSCQPTTELSLNSLLFRAEGIACQHGEGLFFAPPTYDEAMMTKMETKEQCCQKQYNREKLLFVGKQHEVEESSSKLKNSIESEE